MALKRIQTRQSRCTQKRHLHEQISRSLFTMKSDPDKLIKKHGELIHSEMCKVSSHVQREAGEWFLNTVMIEGYDVAFKYKRKKQYRNLTGQRVNLTYYPATEKVAGMDFEIMNVVRIKVS